MPGANINLIPRELKKEFRVREVRKSVNIAGAIILGLSLISAGSLVIAGSMLRRSYNDILAKTKNEEQKIIDMRSLEQDADRLETKINALQNIMKGRKRYSYLLRILSDSTPEGIKVSALTAGLGNDITLAGTADNYITLAKFLLGLIDPDLGGRLFLSVDLSSVSLDERVGLARFLISVKLKEGEMIIK